MSLLIEYSLRVTPGLLLLISIYLMTPRKTVIVKLLYMVVAFILLRDTFTPLGFWEFGSTDFSLWLRFVDNQFILISLSAISLMISYLMIKINKDMQAYIRWWRNQPKITVDFVGGIIGAVVASGPFILLYGNTTPQDRGGQVDTEILIFLLIFTLCGNFMEEVIFRGYIQGYLDTITSSSHSIILTALLFAAGHIFLSTTVTNLGPIILIFTFYEGLICGIVNKYNGLIAATLTHGLTIFALSSGLF